MGTVIEASPKQIEEAKTRLVELENQRRTILASPELRDKGLNELQAKVTEFETNRTNLKFTSTPSQFRRLEEEYNKNKKELSSLQTGQTEEVTEASEIDLNITEPKAVGEDVMKRAIEAVVGIQGVSDEYKQTTKNFLNYVAKAESNYGLNENTFSTTRDAYGPMQIITSQSLSEIKRRLNPKLNEGKPIREYNELLKDNLNIDLMDVTKKDLEQPVVSACRS